jgi:hypothetical protein
MTSNLLAGAASLSALGAERAAALTSIGIGSLRDVLVQPAVIDARVMLAAATGTVRTPAGGVLRDKYQATPADEALALPVSALARVDDRQAKALASIGITSVADLGALAHEVEAIVLRSLTQTNGFSEHPSAPAELIPTLIGSVSTDVAFSSFVQDSNIEQITLKADHGMIEPLPVTFALTDGGSRASVDVLIGQIERDVAAHGLQKVLKELTDSGRSARSLTSFLRKKAQVSGRERRTLGALFDDVRDPQIGLGYILRHRQRWVNLGTNLGQLAHSLPLGPGEPRNIARVRYVRRQQTGRSEDTLINERMDNQFSQDRALEEITSAVARELQSGGTATEAATSATALSLVGSLAVGAGTGAAIGTVVGTPVVGTAIGAAIGAGVAGAVALGFTASSAQALGTIESDSSGDRRIAGELQQRIQLRTSQTASAIRSVYSTVIVEDTQSEDITAESSNITNYNHMHALNMLYFEVLQHYLVTMEIDQVKPFLILPHSVLDFSDFAFIRDYWDVVRGFIGDDSLRQQGDLYFVEDGMPKAPDLEPVPPEPERPQNFIRDLVVEIGYPPRGDAARKVAWRVFAGSPEREGRPIDAVNEANWVHDRFAFSDLRGQDELRLRIDLDRNYGGVIRPKVTIVEATIEGNGRRFELRDVDAGEIVVGTSVRQRSFIKRVDIPDVSSRDDRSFALDKKKRASVLARNAAATEAFAALQADLNRFVSKLERYVRRNRYLLTRAILAGLEPEELTTLLRAVRITQAHSGHGAAPTGALKLSAIADMQPIGFTPGGIVLPLKKLDDTFVARLLRQSGFAPSAVTESPIRDLARYAYATVEYYDNRRNNDPISNTAHVLAPTGGLFAEAVLGRSNSAEYIDTERYFNWQDSPIPNAAPRIADISTDSRFQGREVSVTNPDGNLTIINPQGLPDPSGLGAALAAVQNGAMFRDMSKATELGGIVSGLATLSGQMASAASTMTGQAQAAAMQAASSLAQAAMQASVAAPKTLTERGGELNTAKKIDEAAGQAPNPRPAEPPTGNSPPDNPPPGGTPLPLAPPTTVPRKSLNQKVAERHAGIEPEPDTSNPEKVFIFLFDHKKGHAIDGQIRLVLRKAGLAIADEFGQFSSNVIGASLDSVLTFEANYAEMVVQMEANTVPLRVSLLGKASAFGIDIDLKTSGIIPGLEPNFTAYTFIVTPDTEEVVIEADTRVSAELALTGKTDFDFKSAAEASGKGTISVGGAPTGTAKPLMNKLPKLLETIFKKGVRLHPLLALVTELVDASVNVSGGVAVTAGGGISGTSNASGNVGGTVGARGTFKFDIPTGVFRVEYDRSRSG